MADSTVTFPATRPGTYDADEVFDETTGTWTSDADLLRRDGSRYRTQFVCIGMDTIYYEETT